jgi:FAD:protein FMN transferase
MTQSLHSMSRLRVALGTFVAIDAEASNPADAERGVAAAFAAISAVERLMHPTRRGSDLAALAACPIGTPVTVHAWTFEVLELCQVLHRLSQGIFDPCLDTASGRMCDLELTAQRSVVPPILALRAQGCEGGLVNAGGDLAVFGERSRTLICRSGPRAAAVVLNNAALATSDAQQASRPAEHRGYYHGVDRSAAVFGHITVTAAQAAVADGLTKCLLPGDGALCATLLDAFGARQIR